MKIIYEFDSEEYSHEDDRRLFEAGPQLYRTLSEVMQIVREAEKDLDDFEPNVMDIEDLLQSLHEVIAHSVYSNL